MTRNIKITVIAMSFAAWGALCTAQEMASIDLTGVKPRVDLRFPSAPPAKCNQAGVCTSGGYGGMSIACGAIGPGELRVDLTQLDRFEYFDGDIAEIEVAIENVGKISVQIPSSPHLADLQPADENARFVVRELQVGLFLNWREGYSTSLGWLNLYGDSLHSGTLVTLSPGERLRIRGQITILARHDDGMIPPPLYLAQRASANTSFREVEYIPYPGGLSQRISNENPKEVAGTDQPIHVFAALANN